MQSQTKLAKAIGWEARNLNGKLLGKIVNTIKDQDGEKIEYLIIGSTQFFGRGKRYFAIPASAEFITAGKGGRVMLNASEDDLQFAKGISIDKCPKTNPKIRASIFELFNYSPSKTNTTFTPHKKH